MHTRAKEEEEEERNQHRDARTERQTHKETSLTLFFACMLSSLDCVCVCVCAHMHPLLSLHVLFPLRFSLACLASSSFSLRVFVSHKERRTQRRRRRRRRRLLTISPHDLCSLLLLGRQLNISKRVADARSRDSAEDGSVSDTDRSVRADAHRETVANE